MAHLATETVAGLARGSSFITTLWVHPFPGQMEARCFTVFISFIVFLELGCKPDSHTQSHEFIPGTAKENQFSVVSSVHKTKIKGLC